MSTVMNGPPFWDRLTEVVDQVYGCKSIVAGGAVRDFVVNKQINPKDIDIFVPVESELDLELGIFDLNDEFRHSADFELMEPGGAYPRNDNILGVLAGEVLFVNNAIEKSARHAINIIGKPLEAIADPNVLMNGFDHSLCQFWWDGKEIQSTEAAKKTLDTGVISVYTQDSRTWRRLDDLLTRNKSYSRFTYERDGKSVDYSTKASFQGDAIHLGPGAINRLAGQWINIEPRDARINLQDVGQPWLRGALDDF